jgi:hypothetical protein
VVDAVGRPMKRLREFVVSLAIAILAMIVAESVTSEDGYAQRPRLKWSSRSGRG